MSLKRIGRRGLFLTVAVVAVALPLSAPATRATAAHGEDDHGGARNVLITDQYNNRVIQVDQVTKSIVWSFGSGNPTLCNPGPGTIIGTNDAERLSGGLTLLAGTGIPKGGSPVDPNFSCVDNRVIVVDHS